MNSNVIWQIIGYCGSALVLVSLLMTSVVKLRIINTIGSLVFAVFAFKTNSIPTAVMNVALVLINLYFLYKMMIAKKDFRLLPMSREDSAFLNISAVYEKDMKLYFPAGAPQDADVLLAVYDHETVAGIFAGRTQGDALEILLDYTTPKYRDCSVGKFLYKELAKNHRRLIYTGSNEKHIAYVQKVGFVKENDRYIKQL